MLIDTSYHRSCCATLRASAGGSRTPRGCHARRGPPACSGAAGSRAAGTPAGCQTDAGGAGRSPRRCPGRKRWWRCGGVAGAGGWPPAAAAWGRWGRWRRAARWTRWCCGPGAIAPGPTAPRTCQGLDASAYYSSALASRMGRGGHSKFRQDRTLFTSRSCVCQLL